MLFAVEARQVVKRYPGGTLANDGVNLQVAAGTIHAIVGENGAGKSTLMNMLYGLEAPTAGEIWLRGKRAHLQSPLDAISHGVGMVHQHFMLFPSLSVAENVVMGAEPRRGMAFDRQRAVAQVAALAQKHHLAVDPQAKVGDLPVGMQQRVEILKALYRGAEIIILDEPTAVLTPQETDELLAIMRALAGQGKTVLFISHKLKEVLAVSHRITVLRGGKVVGERATGETDVTELATLMVGHRPAPPALEVGSPGEVVLRVDGLHMADATGRPAVQGVGLTVRAGEIVGVAGVAGNGQSELLAALTGMAPVTRGQVQLLGDDVTRWDVRRRREAGMAHIPEDRHRWGSAKEATLTETAAMGSHYRAPFAGRGLLKPQAWLGHVQRILAEFQVKASGPRAQAGSLSGGNLQKLLVGRELALGGRCLVVAEPSRGVDLGAAAFIHERLLERRRQGAGILLVSSDLSELLALSDRILVMYKGRFVGEVERSQATERQLGLWMAGADLPPLPPGASNQPPVSGGPKGGASA